MGVEVAEPAARNESNEQEHEWGEMPKRRDRQRARYTCCDIALSWTCRGRNDVPAALSKARPPVPPARLFTLLQNVQRVIACCNSRRSCTAAGNQGRFRVVPVQKAETTLLYRRSVKPISKALQDLCIKCESGFSSEEIGVGMQGLRRSATGAQQPEKTRLPGLLPLSTANSTSTYCQS